MNHPAPTELSDFILGKLASPSSDWIEEHLDQCVPCQETLLELSADEDTFVNALRGGSDVELEDPDLSQSSNGPAMLRDYELVERLGQGGMGTVYRARHLKLGRMVAIKVLPSNRMQDHESIARFQREMQAVGALDHTNIVRAYDAGEVDEKHFLAMELIDGVDLAQLTHSIGRLDVSDACEVIRQAAVGLQHAHQHGLVHRDIKPSNLMITCSTPATVKVLDLGLARMLSSRSDSDSGGQHDAQTSDVDPCLSDPVPRFDGERTLTTTHQVMGTPNYMSPEQFTNVRCADVRSDVYSLGATLYKLLTGQAPHSGKQYAKLADKIRGVAEDPPRPLSECRPEIPARLSQVVDRMLKKNPAERFATPGEVAEALQPFAVGNRIDRLAAVAGKLSAGSGSAETRSEQPTAASQYRPATKRNWAVLVGGVLLVALLAPWLPVSMLMGPGDGDPESGSVDGVGAELAAVDVQPTTIASAAPTYLYFSAPLSQIKFGDSDRPGLEPEIRSKLLDQPNSQRSVWTYATLSGPGEAYLSPAAADGRRGDPLRLVAKTSDRRVASGRLTLPDAETGKLIAVSFTIPADRWNRDDQQSFLEVKRDHYRQLARRNIPGSAWFRFQADRCQRELQQQGERWRFVRPSSGTNLDRTFALMSGARAIGENLQLERVIESDAASAKRIPVDGIQGITVNEFDWQALTRGEIPPLDPLAAIIPADQHAFLFSSFRGLLDTLEHSKDEGIALITFAQLSVADNGTLEKYQRQRGLPLNELAQVLGHQFIKSVAITGGDPYFDDGTDIAILFEPTNSAVLSELIEAQIAISARQHEAAEQINGNINGVDYSGYVTPNRSLSTYQATIDGAVVVTNSLVQLRRLVDVAQSRRDALDSLEEFHFFRRRYPLGDDESGLLVVTDPTIRRWCGPRWRIGASRRAYATAALAAAHAEYVVAPQLEGRPIQPQQIDQFSEVAGRIIVDEQGVRSELYGTLDFLTPIAELDLDQVTESESEHYVRWRQQYERRWRRMFDPIAIQFKATQQEWAADVTVMPLAAQSVYEMLVALTQGAQINALAIDQHQAGLIHFSMSIDKKSPLVAIARTALESRMPAPLRSDPFAWMGSTIEVYVDADPVWSELPLGRFDISDAYQRELPLAIGFEVVDGIRLLPFLAGLRTFIEQVAPDMTIWETRQHNDVSYTRISTNPELARDARALAMGGTPAIYYAVLHDKLCFSFNERCLQRAIDRAKERRSDPSATSQQLADGPTPLGKNLNLTMNGDFQVPLQAVMAGANYVTVMRSQSWDNLPILNEWKRLQPDQDPVAFHQQLWGRRLRCRGGGEYVWQQESETMQSSVFGPPGTPVSDDYELPLPLQDVDSVGCGVTFEHGGLRARMEMRRKP